MRVLVLTNMYPTEAEPAFGSFVRDQVQDLRALGAEVSVLQFDGRMARRSYGVAARRLRRRLQDWPCDLIHAHYGLTGAVALAQRRVPVVTTFHGSDCGNPCAPRWHAVVSWFVARLTTPVFVSERLARRLGLPPANVIPCGCDTRLFSPRPRAEARRALGWPDSGRYLLFPAARDNPVKRFDLFDETFQLVARRLPGVRAVTLEGFTREEVALVLNAVDAVLMTSDFEGSPVTVKEALACATPVVSVPVGDVPAVLAGLPGCEIAPRDPDQLAAAAIRALEAGRDDALCRRAEEFSRRRAGGRLILVYENVLSRSRS